MKKLNTWLLACWQLVVACWLVGCSTDEWMEVTPDDAVQFSARIVPLTSARAQVGDQGNEQFQQGDRISLFVTPQGAGFNETLTRNLELTASGWMPALTWQEIGGSHAVFTAFYPAPATQDSQVFRHSVALDQRSTKQLAASDLLAATVKVSQGSPVALAFRHQLSLIQLHLTSSHTFSAEELAQATVRVKACPTVEVDALRGTLAAVEPASQAEAVTFHHGEAGSYTVILPPQSIRETWREGWIEIQLGEHTFTYPAPWELNNGEAFTELQAGNRLTLTLKLDKNQPVEDEWANKTVWTYGLKDLPAVDSWGYAFDVVKNGQHYSTLGLKWKEGYGWYDCNKTHPMIGSGGDSDMCWAAAASNMLYWWLEQNKEYVDRLGYDGPKEYISATQCAIFNHYKKGFDNEGQQVYEALDWFITGYPIREGIKDEVANGFFQAVFGKQAKVASYVPTDNASVFIQTLKRAFRHQEAIECNLLYKSGYLHAINIWGAKFDAKGEVTHIYITDNNDTDLDTQGEFPYLDRFQTQAGILEKPVRFTDGCVYMESSNPGDFSLQIIQLCTLGLMKNEWEAYFKE